MGGTQPERKVGKQGEKRTSGGEEKEGRRRQISRSPNRALVFVVFNGEEEAEARTQSRRPETQSRPRFVVACFRVPPLPPSRPRLNRAVRSRCRVVACARAQPRTDARPQVNAPRARTRTPSCRTSSSASRRRSTSCSRGRCALSARVGRRERRGAGGARRFAPAGSCYDTSRMVLYKSFTLTGWCKTPTG